MLAPKGSFESARRDVNVASTNACWRPFSHPTRGGIARGSVQTVRICSSVRYERRLTAALKVGCGSNCDRWRSNRLRSNSKVA